MSHFTNIISRGFGAFAEYEFPASVQGLINWAYVNLLGLDMEEFDKPYKYPSLNKLFTRELKIPREFDKRKTKDLISPCDSMVTECGKAKGDQVYQIKVVEYKLENLLTDIDKETIDKLKDGEYANFYLSPKDYHRYHAPCNLKVKKLVYVPAKLWPVNMPALKYIKELFVENERVILECETDNEKTMILVYVGALNVGKMEFNFEERVYTNAGYGQAAYEYDDLEIKKGDDMGCFKMGSTVVMFCQPDMVDFSVTSGEDVKFGQTVGKFR